MPRTMDPLTAQPRDTILVVEDHAPFARLVAERLGPAWSVEIALGTRAARRIVATGCVRAAIVDLRLPDGSGLELVRWLAEAHPDIVSLMLTVHFERDLVNELHRLGADYVLKDDWAANIDTFSQRLRDGSSSSLELARRVDAFAVSYSLTERQTEVLKLFVADLGRADIADRLGISSWTLKSHVRQILRKTRKRRLSEIARQIRARRDS